MENDLNDELNKEQADAIDEEIKTEAVKNSSPKKKKRIRHNRMTITLPEKQKAEIEKFAQDHHLKSSASVVADALNYYLAVQKLSEDEHEAALISREIKNEIQLALEPMEERLKRRDRMIEILLNALWHSQQATSGMSDAEAEEILIRAVNDIARAGRSYSANDILAAAKTEHKYVKAKPMSEARKNELNFFDSPERPPRHKYDADESETGNNADGNADKS